MGIWDKYKLNSLPEEHRAEVIKAVAEEVEITNRARLNSSSYQTVRGFAVVVALLAIITLAIVACYFMDSWREVKIKAMTPMVCPPCSAAPIPSFDIKLVPITPPASK